MNSPSKLNLARISLSLRPETAKMSDLPIVIVGAGVVGLVLAQALKKVRDQLLLISRIDRERERAGRYYTL